MKGKNKIILVMLIGIFVFSGCQKTPETSAVVSKVDGLPAESMTEAMAEGETTVISLPEQWSVSELRSNDRVTIQVDLPMGSIEVGNLPVIEMKNHSMTQEELQELVEYFIGDDTLYQIQGDTKQDYAEVIERIRNKEGAYADPNMLSYYTSKLTNLETALEMAEAEENLIEIEEISFQKNPRSEVYYTAAGIEVPEKNQENIFFYADVGEERASHIKVENYEESIENSSSFCWYAGDEIFSASDIAYLMEYAERCVGGLGTEYAVQWLELVERYQALIDEDCFSEQEALQQSEQILTELGIEGLELSAVQKALCFPAGSYHCADAATQDDEMWQADPEQAEQGYEFTFSRGEGGLCADKLDGSYTVGEVYGSYKPPFPVEKITIVVTDTGVKCFDWEGMCEDVSIVAENAKLLPFEEIQEKLFEYIYYRYTDLGQPASDNTKFSYTVYEAWLGYSYVTAYENPRNAWLVPTWFFKAECYKNPGEDDGYTWGTIEIMVNALDGGWIAGQY